MKSGLFIILLSLLFTLPLSACSDQEQKVHSQFQNIINGTPDTSTAHQAVVYLSMNGGACSGTLIADGWVLTAGHCCEGASSIEVYFGNSTSSFTSSTMASHIYLHPNYVGTTQEVYNDICLLSLQSTPSSVTPIPILPTSLAISATDVSNQISLEFVGFGLDEYGGSGVKETTTSPLRGQCSSTTSYCNIGSVSPYQIPPGSISYLQSPGGPCSGDSGGPAFVVRNGTEYVAGVTSYGDQNCSDYGVSTKVDSFVAWIEQYTGGSTSEICTNGVDDDGDGDVDCDDADCAYSSACQEAACDAPATISCGQTISGNASNGTSVYTTNACISQFTEDGPEEAYQLNVTTGTTVTVDLTMGSTNDMDIFLLESSCDTDSCVDGSASDAGQNESFQFTATTSSYYLLVETYNNPGAYELTVTCTGGTTAENCTNGIDDDGDGAIDCDDSDCSSTAACQAVSENCTNGVDDDGDGAIDCDDSDCISSSACVTSPENCTNGIDDDGDGAIDCDDADCASLSSCTTRIEDCTNGIDDDGDGAIDCNDADCASLSSCTQSNSELCANGIDDDGDGKIDCNDPDCVSYAACKAPAEDCANGIDDDGDGAIDCADADCLSYIGCSTQGREICGNGADDDGDGAIDCADADCYSYSKCNGTGISNSDDGCGCRAAGNRSSTSFSLLFLAALMAFVLRRKVA